MKKRIFALCLLASAALAACGGGGGYGGGSNPPPNPGPTGPAGVTGNTIGFSLPDGTIGMVNDPTFGMVGGYTQHIYSQTLAFPPGTVVTLRNLSNTPHTLNVLSTTAFPAQPAALSTAASGTSTLDANYASGSVAAGGTVSVTLANAGTYYIGCAYHFNDANSMRDVLVVQSGAQPGPQATPQPSTGTGGNPCPGGYC